MSTNEVVFGVLNSSAEPLKAGDIVEKSGIDKKEVEKAIKKLVAEGKVDSPKRCFYGVKK